MKEEYICVNPHHILLHLFSLPLLIKEAQLKEGFELVPVLLCILTLHILNFYNIVDIFQHGMEHEHIILFGHLLLFLVVLYFHLLNLMVKNLSPLGLEILFTHDVVIRINTCIKLKHGRIPIPQFEINFAHIPFP